ncbi:MAG: acyl-CoA thioesterase [Bacteroidales bacterium]
MQDPRIKLELRIDWSEMDLFGHVNNLSILKYVQSARANYLENIGMLQTYTENKIGPILAACNCQFIKPLFYPGQVRIYSKVETIKNTSFSILHEIRNGQNEIIAEAKDVIVYYDFIENTKLKLTEEIKFHLMEFVGNEF